MAMQAASEQLSGDSDRSINNSERIAKLEAILPYLATKQDISDLKSDLTWRMVIVMSVMTAVFAAIVTMRPQ